ncbi:MAG: 30S ribosomal protein S21 [Flavobacteriales bacterium]|nr:30S ribosomal protein S21 [Flavobacteriales bacterium]|tara:strand:+ start:11165 stop:11362 length:198 start_codon:yes stop_codon:yes gene_type:complete
MIIIPIKDGESIERPLKRFKRKFEKTKGLKQLRARRYFTKKSEKRREQVLKASYNQRKSTLEDQS